MSGHASPETAIDCLSIVDRLEVLKSEFFRASRDGAGLPTVPELSAYLERCPVEFQSELAVELVAAHLRMSWQQDQRRLIDDYIEPLSRFLADFSTLKKAPLDLIEREFVCRHAFSKDADYPTVADYVSRFDNREDVSERLEKLQLGNNKRYVRLERLGGGGQGRVWLAWDQKLRRHVAIKQPFGPTKPKSAQDENLEERRLENEARIAARLDHAGIVTVHNIELIGSDRPCYVMRFLPGRPLSERIRDFYRRLDSSVTQNSGLVSEPDQDARQVSWTYLVDAFQAVCEAVAYAHERGVVHRDLKPANVIVGDFHDIGVVDWGMAAEISGRNGPTSNQDILGYGTPGYTAPEQSRGVVGGPECDVYSLGAILFELLTGEIPSERHQPIMAPDKWRAPNRGWLEALRLRSLYAVCQRAMSEQPEKRYSSAKEMVEELRLFRATGRVGAWKGPLPMRLWRSAWNHRRASLVVVAALAMTIGSIWGGYELANQRIPRRTSNGIWDNDARNHLTSSSIGGASGSSEVSRTAPSPAFRFQNFESPFVVQRLWADPLQRNSWIHSNVIDFPTSDDANPRRKICEVTFSRRGVGCDVTFKPNENIQAVVNYGEKLVVRVRADAASLRELRASSSERQAYAFRLRVVDDLNHHWAWGNWFPKSNESGEKAVLYSTRDSRGRDMDLADDEPHEFEFDLKSRHNWAFWWGEGSQWPRQSDDTPFSRLDLVVIEPGVAQKNFEESKKHDSHERRLDPTPEGVVGRIYVENIGFCK